MRFRPSPLVLVVVVVLVAVAGLAALAGCSVDTTDSTICGPMGGACELNPNYTPPPSPAPVDTSSGPDDWWWNVNPCGLLTSGELRRLGFPAGQADPVMHSVSSGLSSPENDCLLGFGRNSLYITLAGVPYAYWGEVGGVPLAGDIAFRTADGRPGTILPQLANAGSCHVALQATKGSSAVFLVGRKPGTAVCAVAVKVANVIAPELPPSTQR
jgi:hypothetical protein